MIDPTLLRQGAYRLEQTFGLVLWNYL